jgi:hypothetical protein
MSMMKSMPMTGMKMDMTMMQSCIESCAAAAQAATMCADADMGQEMAKCGAMCANTADVATTMMRMMMRPNGYDMAVMMPMMEACVAMGSACAEECRMHADMHDHCRICAMACDAMVEACTSMMDWMRAA